jgi:hypothetical protein
MMQRRWDVRAKSESGDDYGTLQTFDHEPTEDELKQLCHYDNIGDDGWGAEHIPAGPGYFGSWLHLTVEGPTRAYGVHLEAPKQKAKPKRRRKKRKLCKSNSDTVRSLDELLTTLDAVMVNLSENCDFMDEVGPETFAAFMDFHCTIDYGKYHHFIQLLEKHTNYKG